MSEQIDIREAVLLGAKDSLFFCKTFFPKTFRQGFAPFHPQLWANLEGPEPYIAYELFRGAAKTTNCRAFCAKRVAYGLNRTGVFVSRTEKHAVRSLKWLKMQVLHNTAFAHTFKLRKGGKWTDDEIEIIQGVEEYPVNWVAAGITGQTRGLNIDDYRPDLIVVDDADDDETTRTPEQREKTSDLFFGALQKSLAPSTEAPHRKMIFLQTGQNEEDLINKCHKSSAWRTVKQSCFIYDADGLPRASAWPQRFPFDELMVERQQHIDLNKLSLWLREMECKLTSDELSFFKEEWLHYYDQLPPHMVTVLAIDPASSESKNADDQAVVVVGFNSGTAFICEYVNVKGQNQDELIAEVFRLKTKWRPRRVVVEGIGYQRTLAHQMRKEMQKQNIFFSIHEITSDKRRKTDRIRQTFAARAAEGRLACHATHRDFIEQFKSYPNVSHDDVLDAASRAIEAVDPVTAGDFLEAEWSDAGVRDDYESDFDQELVRMAP